MSAQTPVHALTPDGSAGRGIFRRLAAVLNVTIAIVLCLTPFTAVVVLGWIIRLMRREIVIEIGRHSRSNGSRDVSRKAALVRISALPQLANTARFPGWWKGIWDTMRSAFKAIFAVSLAILPFGTILLLSWWAGWENSFNKGYEQAWVGPVLAANRDFFGDIYTGSSANGTGASRSRTKSGRHMGYWADTPAYWSSRAGAILCLRWRPWFYPGQCFWSRFYRLLSRTSIPICQLHLRQK